MDALKLREPIKLLVINHDSKKQVNQEVDNTKILLDLILLNEDSDRISLRRVVRKIWFDFKDVDTNLTLLNYLETAYEAAFSAKRLYAFGGKTDFLSRFVEFKQDILFIESLLSRFTLPNKFSFIEILEQDLDQNKDFGYSLKLLKETLMELSGMAYYKN